MGLSKRPNLPPTRAPSSARVSDTWRVFSPVVYRYMADEYVNAFFADGSLRLTTFEQCKKHRDEQRQDSDEGRVRVAMSHAQSRDVHSMYEIEAGRNAFVFCTALWHNDGLMKEFGCDSFFRIHDPAEFGARVAAHVPGFIAGMEGPCMYHHKRLIEATFDTTADMHGKVDSSLSRETLQAIQHYPLFLKHKSFSHQAEYRLLWMTSKDLDVDYLDVKVPEARELCSRFGTFEIEDSFWLPPNSR